MLEAPEMKEVMRYVYSKFYQDIEKFCRDGIPADGEWPAIKVNIKVCCDLKTAGSLVGIGGPFRQREFGCHCCEAQKGFDLFEMLTDKYVCDRYCKKYEHPRTSCRHRFYNTTDVILTRKEWLFKVIKEEIQRINGEDFEWKEKLPDRDVEIVTGYKDGEAVTAQVNLRNTIGDDGSPTLDLKHYLKFLLHTEESPQVSTETKMKWGSNVQLPELDENHVLFHYWDKSDDIQEDFNDKVFDDLELRHYQSDELSNMDAPSCLSLLKSRLFLRRRIKQTRNALKCEETKLKLGCVLLDPIVMCLLHLENRTSEFITWHVINAGL